MNVRGWYEAEALTAGLTVHRHTMMGGSEGEIESRIRALYSDVVAVLVYANGKTKATKGESDVLSGQDAVRFTSPA
jgi:hypothetical protein